MKPTGQLTRTMHTEQIVLLFVHFINPVTMHHLSALNLNGCDKTPSILTNTHIFPTLLVMSLFSLAQIKYRQISTDGVVVRRSKGKAQDIHCHFDTVHKATTATCHHIQGNFIWRMLEGWALRSPLEMDGHCNTPLSLCILLNLLFPMQIFTTFSYTCKLSQPSIFG